MPEDGILQHVFIFGTEGGVATAVEGVISAVTITAYGERR
jgi:hypothetical protein